MLYPGQPGGKLTGTLHLVDKVIVKPVAKKPVSVDRIYSRATFRPVFGSFKGRVCTDSIPGVLRIGGNNCIILLSRDPI
ncbi:MAG: hypothetical protein JNJ86_14910 [Chitinophagaceae bacterium]|nr:hypothetical protein [Chitinophagaceae bacterium]